MPKLIKVTLQYVQANAESDWYMKIIEQSDRTKGVVGSSDDDIITVDIVATPSAQDARPTPIYEQLQKGRGLKLVNNAQDCIMSNHRYTEQLNEDIVSWIKSWKPIR